MLPLAAVTSRIIYCIFSGSRDPYYCNYMYVSFTSALLLGWGSTRFIFPQISKTSTFHQHAACHWIWVNFIHLTPSHIKMVVVCIGCFPKIQLIDSVSQVGHMWMFENKWTLQIEQNYITYRIGIGNPALGFESALSKKTQPTRSLRVLFLLEKEKHQPQKKNTLFECQPKSTATKSKTLRNVPFLKGGP